MPPEHKNKIIKEENILEEKDKIIKKKIGCVLNK